jgi:hypothetical protein
MERRESICRIRSKCWKPIDHSAEMACASARLVGWEAPHDVSPTNHSNVSHAKKT